MGEKWTKWKKMEENGYKIEKCTLVHNCKPLQITIYFNFYTFYEKTAVLLAKGHKYISLGLGRLARNPR